MRVLATDKTLCFQEGPEGLWGPYQGFSYILLPSPVSFFFFFFLTVLFDCLEHKQVKCIAVHIAGSDKKVTDLLIISQLYSFIMGERHVLIISVLQAV